MNDLVSDLFSRRESSKSGEAQTTALWNLLPAALDSDLKLIDLVDRHTAGANVMNQGKDGEEEKAYAAFPEQGIAQLSGLAAGAQDEPGMMSGTDLASQIQLNSLRHAGNGFEAAARQANADGNSLPGGGDLHSDLEPAGKSLSDAAAKWEMVADKINNAQPIMTVEA
jgi:hypothetical protein